MNAPHRTQFIRFAWAIKGNPIGLSRNTALSVWFGVCPFCPMLLAYCICCFFFFIILSGFGENLLSHLSSTLEIGEVPEVEAADVNGTGEAHQPDNNHSYILFAVSCVFMHFGSVGSFEPSSLTLFPLCARRPETGLPFHT